MVDEIISLLLYYETDVNKYVGEKRLTDIWTEYVITWGQLPYIHCTDIPFGNVSSCSYEKITSF